jgi:hypothetical protein
VQIVSLKTLTQENLFLFSAHYFMKKFLTHFMLLLSSVVLFSACAANYKTVRPNALNYNNISSDSSLTFSYKYDVLMEAGNKRYAKKEQRKEIKVVAVKITNNTGADLNFSTDVKLYAGMQEAVLVDPVVVHKQLKQTVPTYLFYLLLTPMRFYVAKNGTVTTNIPVGLFLGPGLAIGNMVEASSSNNRLRNDLLRYNIINRTIRPGETVTGLIGLRESGFNPLSLKLNKRM